MEEKAYFVIPNPLEEAGMNPGKNEVVYLCGHPEDLEIMREIASRIRESFHAEIRISKGWEAEADPAELQAVLSEMKAVVIAVTARFLADPGVAGNVVLPAAQAAGCVLLPIALQEGLGSAFTKRFGSLHLMSAAAPDFSRKLESFIERYVNLYADVTVWEEAPKPVVRGRIFLSYRKKDLVRLKEFLSLLRSWKELRDVGVWYDDALVAGEDYNEQIRAQLEACDVFVLVVTPRLLENGNYVIRQEYPDAVRAGKIILPVMMEEADPAVLVEAFPGIGEMCFSGDPGKIRGRLDEAFGRAGGRLPELSGQAWFRLGRAYASGVLTERDRALAKHCFEQSARLEYIWGIVRMARELQESGKETAAIPWMQQAFERLCRKAVTDPDAEKKVFSIAPTVFKLGEDLFRYYMQKEDWRKASELLAEEVPVLQYSLRSGQQSSLISPGTLNLRFGQVFLMSGDTESAETAFSKAEPVLRANAELLHDVRSRMMLFEVCAYYGRTLLSMIRLGQIGPEENILQARRYLERAMEEALALEGVLGRDSLLDVAYMVGSDYVRLKEDYLFLAQDPLQDDAMRRTAEGYLRHFGIFEEVVAEWQQSTPDFPADLRYEGSPERLGQILRGRTLWFEVMVPPEQLPGLFTFDGPAPAGVFGPVEGSLPASGCRCPSCGKNMYRARFAGRHSEQLRAGFAGAQEVRIRESYLCPCGRLFAPAEGHTLTGGPVYSAAPVLDANNPLGRRIFDLWWEYFDGMATGE
ncbi:MAG: toll/interleukin-1 receptor domain-containing protein [Lachnospiraceae bacterium]|nr:toll/interleukin-1 receptor domain-containing protein [Lachnospiraceae bacterium]